MDHNEQPHCLTVKERETGEGVESPFMVTVLIWAML